MDKEPINEEKLSVLTQLVNIAQHACGYNPLGIDAAAERAAVWYRLIRPDIPTNKIILLAKAIFWNRTTNGPFSIGELNLQWTLIGDKLASIHNTMLDANDVILTHKFDQKELQSMIDDD